MNHVIIGIGSNINPEYNIQEATRLISSHFQLLAVSKFRETEPVGVRHQANFINGAVAIRTALNTHQLKAMLRDMEDRLKRERISKHGPRTIDLDIMVWNGKVVDDDVADRIFLQEAIRDLIPEMTFES